MYDTEGNFGDGAAGELSMFPEPLVPFCIDPSDLGNRLFFSGLEDFCDLFGLFPGGAVQKKTKPKY